MEFYLVKAVDLRCHFIVYIMCPRAFYARLFYFDFWSIDFKIELQKKILCNQINLHPTCIEYFNRVSNELKRLLQFILRSFYRKRYR